MKEIERERKDRGVKKRRERTIEWEERERGKGKRWEVEREGRAWP